MSRPTQTFISQIVAGATLDFTTAVPDYPASAGWTLTYYLRGASAYDLTALVDTDGSYRVQASAATTASWTPGDYSWAARVSNASGLVYELGKGSIKILPNLQAQIAGYDGRSQAAKAVDDLKAAFATYTSSKGTVQEYEIAGRRIWFSTSEEILKKLSFWNVELSREKRAEAIAEGLADPRKVYVRAPRV